MAEPLVFSDVCMCPDETRVWFVSESVVDDAACGVEHRTDCRRLDKAAQSASPGDVIRLDPVESAHRLSCVDRRGRLDEGLTLQSVTIMAVNGSSRPTIGCETAASTACSLTLQNVTMIGVDLQVDDCHVTVSGSHLRDTTVRTMRTCRSLRMRVTRTDWTFSGQAPCHHDAQLCRPAPRNRLACASIDLAIDRVRLVLGSLIIFSRYSANISIIGSQFTGDPDHPESQFLGGLDMTFSAVSTNVTVVDCVFSNQASTAVLSPVAALL